MFRNMGGRNLPELLAFEKKIRQRTDGLEQQILFDIGLAEKSFSCENRSCMCWSKRFQTKRTFIYLGFGRTGCHIIFSFERETPTGHEVAEVLFRQKKNVSIISPHPHGQNAF